MMPLSAELTLECPNQHRWVARWPFLNKAVQIPHDDYCPQCGQPGKLVKAVRGE